MTSADEWSAENGGNPMFDGEEDDGDWRDYDDPDYEREPDPEDYEIARDYAEHAEHCLTAHGGGECDCGPSLRARAVWPAWRMFNRLTEPWFRLRVKAYEPWTFRLGPAEVTLRLHADRRCGACGGKGWFYTMSSAEPDPIPPGYNGAALCECGSAIASLAESRRYVRGFDREPPF